jgi:hypothetical protein
MADKLRHFRIEVAIDTPELRAKVRRLTDTRADHADRAPEYAARDAKAKVELALDTEGFEFLSIEEVDDDGAFVLYYPDLVRALNTGSTV